MQCDSIDWRGLTKRPSHSSTNPLDHPLNSILSKLGASPCKVCQLLSVIECLNDDEPKHDLVARRHQPHEYIQLYHGAAHLVMKTAFQKCYYPKGDMRAIQREDEVRAGLQVLHRINSKYYRALRNWLKTCAEWDNRIYYMISKYSDTSTLLFTLFWRHLAPAVRRRKLTSWTLAGWVGPMRFNKSLTYFKEVYLLPPSYHQL